MENIEPRLLKQTVSESTSEKIREYCNQVVVGEKGTGKTARPAGYLIGGKTGTAETLPRKNGQYVVSFMGYAPADDPQIAIYVVVDRPNVPSQDDAKHATRIVRNILTEVLPYMGIFMTEELSDKERAELEALQVEIMTPVVPEEDGAQEGEGVEGTGEGGTGGEAGEGAGDGGTGTGNEGQESGEGAVEDTHTDIWKTFPIDPETGYAKDPDTGFLVDPDTGHVFNEENSSPPGLGGTDNIPGSEDDRNPF